MKAYPPTPKDWEKMDVVLTDSELLIGGWQVMQRWEQPLMETMANEVTANKGDILEVGFGMGISADAIVKCGCRTYTVIEAHPKVADTAREWAKHQKVQVNVLQGLWQESVPNLKQQYDGILFDTYPLSAKERHRNHFAFIPFAPRLLRPKGIFTYYSDETVDFRIEHLTLLLTHFTEVKLIKVTGLEPPANCEYWHDSYMVIPVARNPD